MSLGARGEKKEELERLYRDRERTKEAKRNCLYRLKVFFHTAIRQSSFIIQETHVVGKKAMVCGVRLTNIFVVTVSGVGLRP